MATCIHPSLFYRKIFHLLVYSRYWLSYASQPVSEYVISVTGVGPCTLCFSQTFCKVEHYAMKIVTKVSWHSHTTGVV